jgi:hypothetical protein
MVTKEMVLECLSHLEGPDSESEIVSLKKASSFPALPRSSPWRQARAAPKIIIE